MVRERILIAGGGVAALELVLGLRVLAGARPDITLLTPVAEFAPPAMTVASPFGRGGARRQDWRAIAADQDVRLVVDKLVAVDVATRLAYTAGGRRMPYDTFVVATGARRVSPLAGALTFGTREDIADDLRAVVRDLLAGESESVTFALASPSIWPLPLYELALLTADELREHGCDAAVRIVTPEQRPLELFGATAGEFVVPLLRARGVELVLGSCPRAVRPAVLELDGGEVVASDHVVTFADALARPIAGLPVDRMGFIPVDGHGSVAGPPGVFAAGEATSFPLRQGGLAAQQADAVPEAIAARLGDGRDPLAFRPVLRGRMLTSGAPLYLQARPSGQSLASTRALWAPPAKIAGRYLAPYLATARPPQLAAAPLVERVPALPGGGGEEGDATTLALAIADAELRCGNAMRALQAFEAALALDPGARRPAIEALAGDAREVLS